MKVVAMALKSFLTGLGERSIKTALAYPGWIVGIWGLLMLAATPLNYWVCDLRGGPIDDSLYPGDPYRVRHEKALEPGFNARDIYTVLRDVKNISPPELEEVLRLTKALNADKNVAAVLSPSTLPEFRDNGHEIAGIPYITVQELGSFDTERWMERVRKNGSLWNMLVGPNFDWISMGIIPYTDDDNEIAWHLAEVIENREISWFEKILWKIDLFPADPNIRAIGLGFARWTIDRTLNWDLLMRPFLGVLISLGIQIIYLRSFRQAMLGTTINVVGGIWLGRAAIYLLHLFIPEIRERVYTQLDYAICIVVGTSLTIHMIEAFRDAPGNSSREKFENGMQRISYTIYMIAVIGMCSFFFMRGYRVWQMTELGLQSAVAVGIIVFFSSTMVLPAMYMLTERWRGPEKEHARTWKSSRKWKFLLSWQVPVIPGLCLIGTLSALVIFLFITGRIQTKTRPLDYIKETLVEKSSRIQEVKGSGNDILPLKVRYRDPATMQQIFMYGNFPLEYLKNAWRLQKDLRPGGAFEEWQVNRFGNVRKFVAVASILDMYAQIAEVETIIEWEENGWGKPPAQDYFPISDQQADDYLAIIKSGIKNPGISTWSWGSEGMRMSGFAVINDSHEFRELIERSVRYAEEYYPMLEILPFGKGTFYPQVDWLITNGEGFNIGINLLMLIALYALLLAANGGIRPFWGACTLTIPFVFGVDIVGICMYLFGIPLSMSTAPIAEMAINAAADFGLFLVGVYIVHLQLGKKPEEAMREAILISGSVIVVDCLLNATAFAPLLTSRFQPVVEVGGAMIILLLMCVVGAIFIVPNFLLCVTIEEKKEVYHDMPFSGSFSSASRAALSG